MKEENKNYVENTKVFIVTHSEKFMYCQDIRMVVIASDAERAEAIARQKSDDFKNAKEVTAEEIDMSYEQVVLVENTGA